MTETTTPVLDADTAAWIQRADAWLARVSSNPNDLLAELLRTECIIKFQMEPEGELIQADLWTPDNQWVSGTGQNAAHALYVAYTSGRAKSAHAALQGAAIVATAPAGITAETMPPVLSLVK